MLTVNTSPLPKKLTDRPLSSIKNNNNLSGCVQTIVKRGGDLDTVTLVTGDTPLHLAAARGHLAVVKYIISSVEDWVEILAAINNDAETPLEKAILSEQNDVVDYLSNLQAS